ncbi:glutaredoxin family protein [Mailhella massiliensis]|uniref:Glutaredoxin family protein n=1 Tax=Mailhella massiliensis TaxID=1903261 RepID=A0A921AWH1_9BACT|nr:glutaredoxin family protein [Mailhella massiliensis]HJD97418.1 glutaredoxin family protein [Mailhella massiliensis]
MNSSIAIIAAIAVIAVIAVLFLKKKNTPVQKEEKSGETGSQGDPELYALGMNPISPKPIMYALTTCQHCKNTRKFLDANNVDYTVIYLDEYSGSQRSDLMEKVRTYNPRGTFPTILVPGGKVIVGFRKQLMQEALFHDAGTTA